MLIASAGLSGAVTGGSLLVAAAVAVLVGVVGFLSPCVLPLVPGYLSYVAGLSGADEQPSQRRMATGALLFVAGFTALFVSEGIVFGQLGDTITTHTLVIDRVLGAVTIIMGVAFLGQIPFLQRELRLHRRPRAGLLGAPLLGFVFGLAWTPCSTPTLGAVMTMAYTQGTAERGALLQACYCLGLGLPFILVALGFGWVTGTLAFVRRHMRIVSRAGGLLLIGIGILLVTGEWAHTIDWLHGQVGPGGFQI